MSEKGQQAEQNRINERETDRQKKHISLVKKKKLSCKVSLWATTYCSHSNWRPASPEGNEKRSHDSYPNNSSLESKYTEVNCHPQTGKLTAVRRRGHAENKQTKEITSSSLSSTASSLVVIVLPFASRDLSCVDLSRQSACRREAVTSSCQQDTVK